jgi:hypothetical protein
MRRLFKGCILTLVVSFYFFPFSFPFLPEAINTKIIMAVFGLLAFAYNSIRKSGLYFSEPTLFSALLASIFSIWCLFSITASNSYDTAYAQYLVSYITWMAGAYGVYAALSLGYEKVDLEVLIRYLAMVGVFQCIIAVLIDNVAFVENLVDKIMFQADDYYKEHHRMYGLGAALDPAGVRFSVILIMLSHLFSNNVRVKENNYYQTSVLAAYAIITIIGAVISRTTVIGSLMGLAYIIITLFRMRKGGFVTIGMIQAFFWFFIVLAMVVGAAIYFYRISETFQGYLRFGFEGFFNWVETGEFRTSSTDTLSTMWVWPDDIRTWIIGRGTFGVYENFSDIGYCNFILYCGLIGLVLFSIFFLYCHIVQNRKFRHFDTASVLLIALTFIVWLKVTTDIFFIDALLFCIVGDHEDAEVDPKVVIPRE